MRKKELIEEIGRKGYKLLEWNCNLKQSNSLHYPNNSIILVLEKNGVIYNIEVHGSIIFTMDKKRFNKTDKGLTIKEVKLLKNGKAELESNNWIEMLILKKGNKNWECEFGDVIFDIKEIPLLLD